MIVGKFNDLICI